MGCFWLLLVVAGRCFKIFFQCAEEIPKFSPCQCFDVSVLWVATDEEVDQTGFAVILVTSFMDLEASHALSPNWTHQHRFYR